MHRSIQVFIEHFSFFQDCFRIVDLLIVVCFKLWNVWFTMLSFFHSQKILVFFFVIFTPTYPESSCGRRGGLMVSALVRSERSGFEPWPGDTALLGKTRNSRSVSLHSGDTGKLSPPRTICVSACLLETVTELWEKCNLTVIVFWTVNITKQKCAIQCGSS